MDLNQVKRENDKFLNEYLENRSIEKLNDAEKRNILIKAKNHFIFFRNITKEPALVKSSNRYQDAINKMKILTLLKDKILDTINKN